VATSTRTRTARKTTTPETGAPETPAPEPTAPAATTPAEPTTDETGHGDTLEERSTEPQPEAPEEPTVEEPRKLTARERKARLAQDLITAGADAIEQWDPELHEGITQDDARADFALWLKYLPRNGGWDSRLGPDPAAK
jgi:hypothetical protein